MQGEEEMQMQTILVKQLGYKEVERDWELERGIGQKERLKHGHERKEKSTRKKIKTEEREEAGRAELQSTGLRRKESPSFEGKKEGWQQRQMEW